MSTKSLLFGALLVAPVGLAALALPEPAAAVAPEPAEFSIDQTHTSALFKVKHVGASWFYGRFNGVDGTIQVDEEEPANSYVLLKIDAASVDTNNDRLDGHIKSPDFLDAGQFPELVFESESVKKGKEKDSVDVTGNLTIRGVTKPLSVTVHKVGEGEMQGGKKLGYHTSFTIDRTDYGVSYDPDGKGVGKEVELIISVEANG